jgi:hypothetical protein
MSFGMISSAFGSDKPNLKLTKVTKNKDIQGQINTALGKSKDTFALSEQNIGSFMDRFGANSPRFDEYSERDIDTIGGLYDGRIASDLAGLRGQATAARGDATQRALDMIAGRDRAYAAQMGMPGRSSYRDLMGARLSRDAMIDAALAEAGQARSDYGYLSGQQFGNLGRQQAILAGQEGREFMPLQAVAAARGAPMANLNNLANLDQLNNFYGTYRKRGTLERLANAEQVGMDQLSQITSMVGDVAGVAGAFCWVARECLGTKDGKWKVFRRWMLSSAPNWFRSAYIKNGESLAAYLSTHPVLRLLVRELILGILRMPKIHTSQLSGLLQEALCVPVYFLLVLHGSPTCNSLENKVHCCQFFRESFPVGAHPCRQGKFGNPSIARTLLFPLRRSWAKISSLVRSISASFASISGTSNSDCNHACNYVAYCSFGNRSLTEPPSAS